MRYAKRDYTGRTRRHYFLRAFDLRGDIALPGRKFTHYDSVSEEYLLHLTENFCLPFSAGVLKDREYRIQTAVYTEEEATALATWEIEKFLEELSEKGMKISSNNVKIIVSDGTCISKGSVMVIEKTGDEEPVTRKELPLERTAEDEQSYYRTTS